jgi:hypothetical protein
VKGKWDKPVRLVQIAPVWRQVGCDVDGVGVFYDFLPEVICQWTVVWAFVGEALFDDEGSWSGVWAGEVVRLLLCWICRAG